MYDILQSSTQSALLFLLVQSSDHITGLTGASPTVTLSKNGAAFGSPSGAVTEIGSGWYKVAGNATDTATLGPLALHATAASADPCDLLVANIVAYNPQTTSMGLALAKTTNITGFNDIAATAIVSSGAITTSGGAVSTVTAVTDKAGYSLSASQTFNLTGNISGSVGSVTGITASDVGAIKTQTDKLTFTVANQIDSNVQYVNDTQVTGNGHSGTEWGPA